MMQYKVKTPNQALAYITDCTLATVQHMAMRKTRPSGEFSRQINIAQTAVDWMVLMNVDFTETRAHEVVTKFGGSVMAYANHYDIKRVQK